MGVPRSKVVSVAVLGALLIGICAFDQPIRRERLAFALVEELIGPRTDDALTELGTERVPIRAPDYNQRYARRTLAQLMRRCVAIGDVNGDGIPDLYVIGRGSPNLLLLGAPDGSFRDATNVWRLAGPEDALSAAFSDYDQSGHQSLFVVGAEGIKLYRNNGRNSFIDVTRKAGLQTTPGNLYTSVTLADVDSDTFPDVLVAGYTDLNHPPQKASFILPNDFPGIAGRLYRNNRNGTFTDVTESSGLSTNRGRARKAILADFNNDDRLDILLLRDDKPPVMYLNRGGWNFEDTTWHAGDDLTTHAFFEGAVRDFNKDGRADLALWSTHSFRVLLNRGNARFERLTNTAMPEPMISLFGFRGTAADLDNNGFDDIITVDHDGGMRTFANQAGKFREVTLALPQSYEGSYLAPLPLKNGTSLLAIQTDGRIAVLRRNTDGVQPQQAKRSGY